MILKRNYLWIALFGSLIGLSETLIGSAKIPYSSVVLSAITLVLLSVARYYFPKKGTSMLIIIIAILFKINSFGIQCCTTQFLLCGPTALLLLGISYEVFASLFISKKTSRYTGNILTCGLTSILAFAIFAIIQTYILKSWDNARLVNYTFVRGSLTALASGSITTLGLYLAQRFGNFSFTRLNPYVLSGILGALIIAFWFLGVYSG